MRKLISFFVVFWLPISPLYAKPKAPAAMGYFEWNACGEPDTSPDDTISYCGTILRVSLGSSDFPRIISLLIDIGGAYRQKGEEADARKHFDAAVRIATQRLAIFPDDPRMLSERCWVRAVANIELDAAFGDCERAHQLRPDNALISGRLGFVLYRLGRYREALEAYSDSLKGMLVDAGFQYMRGVVKRKLGDDSGGALDIRAAIDRNSKAVAKYGIYGVERIEP